MERTPEENMGEKLCSPADTINSLEDQESSVVKDFKILVQAEVHSITPHIECSSSKCVSGKNPKYSCSIEQFDDINEIKIISDDECFPPVVFTIGDDIDLVESSIEDIPAEIIQMQLAEDQDCREIERRLELSIKGFFAAATFLAVVIFAACIYEAVNVS